MMRRTGYCSLVILFAVMTLFAREQAVAEPFVFSFNGTGTGTLDVFSFTDAAFGIRLFAETTDFGGPVARSRLATIDISFAHGTFLNSILIFDNQSASVLGLQRTSGGGISSTLGIRRSPHTI